MVQGVRPLTETLSRLLSEIEQAARAAEVEFLWLCENGVYPGDVEQASRLLMTISNAATLMSFQLAGTLAHAPR